MRVNLTEKIITSSRGKPKLGYEGYFYNYKEDLRDKKSGDVTQEAVRPC